MACKLFKKPKLLSEFLEISKNNEYFSATTSNALIKNLTFLKHMPILQSNIEKQWSSDTNITENNLKIYGNIKTAKANSTLLDKYSMICERDPSAKLTPFGIIEINQQEKIDVNQDEQEDPAGGKTSVQLNQGAKRLTCSYLLTDAQSHTYFYRVPRLRKLWWMKYAANPGRFVISEVKQDKINDVKKVTIKAEYPFGALDIESIELLPLDAIEPNLKPQKSDPTKVIRTTVLSDIAAIETVFDAIDAGDFGEMCINRNIAPYQCAVYCVSQDPSDVIDLYDLSRYISMLLQECNIEVLHSEDILFPQKTNIDDEFNKIDSIGIPYSLILDVESLNTGLMKLRNRDTTLSETIHISFLTEYLSKIFKV